jgi:hypothetical protein
MMQGASRLATQLLITLTLSVPAFAQAKTTAPAVDLTGTWAGHIKTDVSYSPITINFRFEQKPDGLTGFAWPGAAQVPITNVTRDGDRVAFQIAGEEIVYRFTLVATANRLEGDVAADDHGHTWKGTAALERNKPGHAGTD